MDLTISCGKKELNVRAVDPGGCKICILFLSGGGVKLGKERYFEWQERLRSEGVCSISFDYSGVNDSGDSLEHSSLEGRIEEAKCVAEWMKKNVPAREYVLYGVSMGGYIALGLVATISDIFSKLILHAPAAYSSKVHRLTFGEKFTEEIRKKNSWEDSPSFEWLENYGKPVLLVEAERDEIIPAGILERYEIEKKKDKDCIVFVLNGATHNVWEGTPENAQFRNEILEAIIAFVK